MEVYTGLADNARGSMNGQGDCLKKNVMNLALQS